nr:hypothetical protein [Walnut Creek virus]
MLNNARLEAIVVGGADYEKFGNKLEVFLGMYKKILGQTKTENTIWRNSLLILMAYGEPSKTNPVLNQLHSVVNKLVDYGPLPGFHPDESFYRQTSFVPLDPERDAGAWVIIDLIPSYGHGPLCADVWDDA